MPGRNSSTSLSCRRASRPEHRLELAPQHAVDLVHGRDDAEVGEAGDALAADAARHDAGEMLEHRIDVERDAVEGHPAPHADADGGDLVLAADALLRPLHPDADGVLAPAGGDVEGGERADDPFLQRVDVEPDVRLAAVEIEHQVGDPLAGAVIGVLAAAPGPVDREAIRRQQVRRLGAGAGGVERCVLHQPDALGGCSLADGGDAGLHGGDRFVIIDAPVGNGPLDRRCTGRRTHGPARRRGAGCRFLWKIKHGVCPAGAEGGSWR